MASLAPAFLPGAIGAAGDADAAQGKLHHRWPLALRPFQDARGRAHAEGIQLCPLGNSQNLIVIIVDRRARCILAHTCRGMFERHALILAPNAAAVLTRSRIDQDIVLAWFDGGSCSLAVQLGHHGGQARRSVYAETWK